MNAMHFLTNLVESIPNPLNLPQLTIEGFSIMAWLITITVFVCLFGIIYLILWIRKIEKKVDDFFTYLKMLDDKNYRLWKARLKSEGKL